MSGKYDDIIDLPHPTSKKHSRMSRQNLAAQFLPFAALTGYDVVIRETARITEDRRELSEDAVVELNYKISLLQQEQAGMKKIKVIYFRHDTTKDAGAYREEDGGFKRIKSNEGILELTNSIQIPLEDIFKIEIV
ncbi:hypothetical protein [Anaerotignum lactatifermentans]|uniref:YolD-like protein n=1 Tax=Anaerotignum lactatifermentans DSM 14214 TaxID=1121323 RepID=A0A1M7AQB4_9FIRM|nr:hypothetical protein [Anaerotignum lactatifermentans]SHL44901.1 hypothetical protein SAMN02745138_03444 [[Clostridium] lactatifermentans DSM 14214] [Anaerotignum lactatifermentans DSM 14214]